jgi:hypothetical protein
VRGPRQRRDGVLGLEQMMKERRVAEAHHLGVGVVSGIAGPADVLELVEVERCRQLPIDAPQASAQRKEQDDEQPDVGEPGI